MLHVSIGAHRQVIFVPSSTNLDKNMAKLPIGWSSSTDLHVEQMLFAVGWSRKWFFLFTRNLLVAVSKAVNREDKRSRR